MRVRFQPALAILLVSGVLPGCIFSGDRAEPIPTTAAEIHDWALTVDTHVDWPTRQYYNKDFDARVRHEPGSEGAGQWDLVRMKEGGLDAIFMAIFTGQRELTPERRSEALAMALEQIALAEKMVADAPDLAEIALTGDDAYRIEKAGKRAIFLGLENGFPIGIDLSNVEMFFRKGIRYITLCHGGNNDICDSSTDDETLWAGLSPFGEQVVREMNRVGIMVDVSHVHDDTFRDVLHVSRAPLIASHSSARALCDHARNMSDEMIRALAQNGGVVQICLVGSFIKTLPPDPEREAAIEAIREELGALRRGELQGETAALVREKYRKINQRHPRPRPDLTDAVDHIDHIVRLVGVDHVGIGTDFDGGGGLRDLNDISELPMITEELVRRGYSTADIRKIWGENLMRVLREAERISNRK